MRVLIVDDEPAARRRLAIMLEELDVEVVGEAENGVVALERVRERRPDLLLLDISMPEVDGFDVARHLPVPRPLIVFQTAHDEHALRAFDHAALDYLVKPVALDRLEQAIERAREWLDRRAPQPLAPEVLEAVRAAVFGGEGDRGRERQGGTAGNAAAGRDAGGAHATGAGEGYPGTGGARRSRILVRERGGHRLLPLADVLRFVAGDGVVYAHTAGDRFLTDYTLKEIESRTGDAFVRTSRGELVNLDHIVRIAGRGDGSATLGLSDGGTAHVSRRRAAEVKRIIEG